MRGYKYDDYGLEEDQYYSIEEVCSLMGVMRDAHSCGKFEAVRDWFLVLFDLNTGLRVEELTDLKHGDFFVELGKCYVVVREGKGDKKRNVAISEELRRDYLYFVEWKQSCIRDEKKRFVGLSTAKDAPVFSKRHGGKLTVRAVQKHFSKYAFLAGLENGGIHCLRRTYLTHLLGCNGQPRFVQKQAGHTSLKTTQRYLGISKNKQQIKESLSNLYKLYGTKG